MFAWLTNNIGSPEPYFKSWSSFLQIWWRSTLWKKRNTITAGKEVTWHKLLPNNSKILQLLRKLPSVIVRRRIAQHYPVLRINAKQRCQMKNSMKELGGGGEVGCKHFLLTFCVFTWMLSITGYNSSQYKAVWTGKMEFNFQRVWYNGNTSVCQDLTEQLNNLKHLSQCTIKKRKRIIESFKKRKNTPMKITFQEDTLYLAAIHDKFKCKCPTAFLPLYEIQNYCIVSASNSEPVICFQAYRLQAVNCMHNKLCCCIISTFLPSQNLCGDSKQRFCLLLLT